MSSHLVARTVEQPESPRNAEAALMLAARLKACPDPPSRPLQRLLMLESVLVKVRLQLEKTRPSTLGPPADAALHMPTMAPMSIGAAGSPLPRTVGASSSTGSFLRSAASVCAGVLGVGRDVPGSAAQAPTEVFQTTNAFAETSRGRTPAWPASSATVRGNGSRQTPRTPVSPTGTATAGECEQNVDRVARVRPCRSDHLLTPIRSKVLFRAAQSQRH